jgi:glycosyltransferase involved in cell wall biosynthesis
MRILFLDQSGKLGGAELSLLDIADFYRDRCLVGLFQDGPFRHRLDQRGIPIQILASALPEIRKDSRLLGSLVSSRQYLQLARSISQLAKNYDLIYANTPKAMIVGAIASKLSRRPLVYHLRDILSPDHFSRVNIRLLVTLSNLCAAKVIANSQATAEAFIQSGGNPALVTVIYNGFNPQTYAPQTANQPLRQQLFADVTNVSYVDKPFIVGHFSRLSPWKGQHILLEALTHCPEHVKAVFVGDALFGEQEYVASLQEQVAKLGLNDRVKFVGFQSDVPAWMQACDLIAHTSISPEPFGRVIIEAMLCKKPIVAAAAGGANELINSNETGWLVQPGNSCALADSIQDCMNHASQTQQIVQQAYESAIENYSLSQVYSQVEQLLISVTQSTQRTTTNPPAVKQPAIY